MTTHTYSRHQTNHLLHLVLTLLTCGLWGFVWPCVWAWNRFGPRKVTTTVGDPMVYGQPPHWSHQTARYGPRQAPPPPPVRSND